VSTDRDPFPTPDEILAQQAEANLKFASEFAWEGKRLVALDRSVMDKLERKKYSASSAKSIAGCSVRWAYEKTAEVKGPYNAAVLGTAMHSCNEYLFALPPADRSLEKADRFFEDLALERWPDSLDMDPSEILRERAQWLHEIQIRNAGYLARIDLTAIKVIENEMKLEGLFHDVPTIAFLDRVDDLSDEFGPGKVGIVDYKSSTKLPNLRYGDEHGDQQRLYKALYESIHGAGTVVRVTLEYTRLGTAVEVDVSDAAVTKTVDSYVKSWARHNRIMKSGELLTEKSTLCGWCAIVNSCPVAAAAGKTDMKGGAPSSLMLPLRVVTEAERISPQVTQADEVPGDYLGMSETAEVTPAEIVKGPEGRPWEFSIDGVRNPGSYEYLAVFGASNMAMQMIAKSQFPMTESTLTGLAATIHQMSCEVQRQWLGGVDLMATSHTRCRGAVSTVIETMDPPFGGTAAAWDEWVTKGIKRALALTTTVTRVVAGDVQKYPWLLLSSDGQAVLERRIAADQSVEAEANRAAVAEVLSEDESSPIPEPAPAVDFAAPVETLPSSLAGMQFDF
jgi:putative RecB family exonuclease